MAVAGGATVAYAIKWNPELHQVIVLTKTTVAKDRCDSLVNACALLSKGQNALIAGPEIEQVRQRMFARMAAMQHPQEE
jgi:hypothetical protein